jgi:hypothetical protein
MNQFFLEKKGTNNLLFLFLFLFPGCSDDNDDTITAATSALSSIVLKSSQTSPTADGSSQITVTATLVVTGTYNVDGVTVQFTTTDGTLSATSATTDASGVASISLTAPSSAGVVKITATVGSVSNYKNITYVSQSSSTTTTTSTAEVESITLASANSSVYADGSTTIKLNATVKDSSGVTLNGKTVTFKATSGTLSASSALSNSKGVASVSLTAPSQTIAKAIITASSNSYNAYTEIAFIPSVADSSRSSVTANPSTLSADGTSTTTITAILLDANGNPVADGTSVTIYSTSGTITSENPKTTVQGRATFTLTASTETGTGNISISEYSGITGSVNFGAASSGSPRAITITSAASHIFVAGVGQTENTNINLKIVDDAGNPITESTLYSSSFNNVKVTLLSGPAGGEFVAGTNVGGSIVNATIATASRVRSQNGLLTLNCKAGSLPGAIQVKVEALAAEGTHDGNDNAAVLTDSSESWTSDAFIGMYVYNETDKSTGLITDNDGTTITATLSGGTDNNWDSNDVAIIIPATGIASQINISSGPPHTIALSKPSAHSITNMQNGLYCRTGVAVVTDQYGNAVPDGTIINLSLIDSVITEASDGVINAEQTVLTSAGADFDDVSITRDEEARKIRTNDRVLLEGVAVADKSRFIASAPSSNNTLTLQAKYLNSDTAKHYIVGSSLLGGFIGGGDDCTKLTAGLATTTGGIAPFKVTYPIHNNNSNNNQGRIMVGCMGYTGNTYSNIDTRYAQPSSAQVIVVASSDNNEVTTMTKGTFCFSGISPGKLTAIPDGVSGNGNHNISLYLTDSTGDLVVQGEGITIPFSDIYCQSVTYSGTTEVTINNANNTVTTNANGVGVLQITVPAQDINATITCTSYSFDISETISVKYDAP